MSIENIKVQGNENIKIKSNDNTEVLIYVWTEGKGLIFKQLEGEQRKMRCIWRHNGQKPSKPDLK